jgi:hypothetical protein
MIRDYEVRQGLERIARDIHGYDSNPITWQSWITYLLAQLENQATDVDPANHARYEEMLSNLKDAIHNREQTGGW